MKLHRSRFRRLLRFCLFAFLALLLLTAGGLWWAHRNLTSLAVDFVNRTFPELHLSAKTVAISRAGILDLKDIKLRVRTGDSEAISIPSAKVRFAWDELRQNIIREIEIDQPDVRLNDALLATTRSPSSTTPPPASPSENPSAPWRVGKITVNGGRARVDLAGFPAARFGFDVQMDEAHPSVNEIRITSLRLRDSEGATEPLVLPSLRVRGADLPHQKVRELIIDSPQIHLTEKLLALLQKSSASSQNTSANAPDVTRAILPADPSGTAPLATPWTCDRLTIQNGNVKANLPGWPRAEFNFAVQGERLTSDGGAIELSVTGLATALRGDSRKAFSFSSLRVSGTVGGLMRGAVQELSIEDPIIQVTDRLLAWRPPTLTPAPSTSANSPSPSAAPPPTATPPLPWKVERLAIKRGRAVVDLEGAPLAKFSFEARAQNAGPGSSVPEELQSAEILDLVLHTRTAGVEPFLRIPTIRAEFRIADLFEKRRLARLRIEHLDFRYNLPFREMIASGAKPQPVRPEPSATTPATVQAATEKAPPWTIGELRLLDGRLHLDDLGIGIPGIEARLETAFRELAVEPGGGAGGQELQTIELSQIALRSPLDPFATVLNLDTVFVRFTLAGIWKRQIAEVAIVRPTLAIGPDLFWYVDRVQQNQSAPPADAPAITPAPTPALADDGPPWVIQNFSAKAGQLVLALEGQAKLALPMPFESRAENLNFRRLSELRLKLQIDMPEQDYDYPGYELALRGVSGRVEFSLPPEKRSNNVVNTLRLRGVRWKNFTGRDLFLDVTYDENGIYGNLTGKGYTGIVRGQFNFLLTPESDWDGWVSGTHIDLQPITAALAPEKFSLSSPADFRLSVKARATEILNVAGDFKATSRGKMRIGKLDEMIRDLPGDWSSMKKALSRISLETLRDFAYDTAHGDFKFNGLVGDVRIDLQGPSGARKIEMNFREAPANAPRGRVATSR